MEEKLLESCLCSEKESVLTFRAALQKCPGQGLRAREGKGQGVTWALRLEASLLEQQLGLEAMAGPHQPVPHPRRKACSWWATFSSSASMADRLSSSWSSALRLALPSSSFFSSKSLRASTLSSLEDGLQPLRS